MRAALRGDVVAWDELTEEFGERTWGVGRSLGLSVTDATTVAETTWLRLADRLGGHGHPRQVSTWLTATAYTESQRLIRLREQLSGDRDRIPPAEAFASDGASADHRLYDAYSALPARCRLLLRLLCGEPRIRYREVSQAMDLPIGSIGPTRQRCLTTLLRHHAYASPDVLSPLEAPGAALDRVSTHLGRALALIDGVPPAVSATARGAYRERRDGIETAEIVFDTAVDAGPTPDFGDSADTRIVVFRAQRTSVVLRVTPNPITGMKGMIVGSSGMAVSQRAPGGLTVAVSDAATTEFSIQWVSRGVFSLVLTPTTSPGPAIATDWFVLYPPQDA